MQRSNKLIKIDQTGFIPGRQEANNISRILNISSTKYKSQSLMILGSDAQKAFDGVKWSFL